MLKAWDENIQSPFSPPPQTPVCILPHFLETNKWIFNLCNGKDAK
jgi:hypothetical protein